MTSTSVSRAGSATSADGVAITYRRWPGTGEVPLVLVHGTSAHAGWWDHMVPALPERFAVVTMDLAGHGDSGRRSAYSIDGWAEDVLAVVRALDAGPAVLVGHSIGGLVVAGAAVLDPAAVAGTVLVDTIVQDPEHDVLPEWRPPRAERVFASLDEVAGRFRLTPPQPEADPVVLRSIAESSVRATERGLVWKVDPLIFGAVGRPGLGGRLPDLPGPVAIVRGELSVLVPPEAGAQLEALIHRAVPQFDVAGAHHHLMIDHPVELGEALRDALDAIAPGS
ncbi:MAG: alpha/beta hydrolase [Pseudonocardia sp.]|nr:alpha/beta hydrolase [Pseudonocardia sp.]